MKSTLQIPENIVIQFVLMLKTLNLKSLKTQIILF